jgi:hypothetical protein
MRNQYRSNSQLILAALSVTYSAPKVPAPSSLSLREFNPKKRSNAVRDFWRDTFDLFELFRRRLATKEVPHS